MVRMVVVLALPKSVKGVFIPDMVEFLAQMISSGLILVVISIVEFDTIDIVNGIVSSSVTLWLLLLLQIWFICYLVVIMVLVSLLPEMEIR